MFRDINGYELCNGCGICTLPCPIWQQSHEAVLTFKGRAQALQGGAEPDELRESVGACLLCGSCEPACTMGIKTVDITLQLRAAFNGNKNDLPKEIFSAPTSGFDILIPDTATREQKELLDHITSLLDVKVADDDGLDILGDFENGITPGVERLRSFLQKLIGIRRVIIADGLFKRYLRAMLPGLEVTGIGEVLLKLPEVQSSLKSTDLYIIESRSYNIDFDKCMPFYTDVSRQTGCAMNLDLQRIAIPTGSHCQEDHNTKSGTRTTEQIRWILEGRCFDRVVVESVADMEHLKKAGGVHVVHVSELVEGNIK
jgi:ferredoxin